MSGAAARLREVVWVREAGRPGAATDPTRVPVDPARKKGVGSVGVDGSARRREAGGGLAERQGPLELEGQGGPRKEPLAARPGQGGLGQEPAAGQPGQGGPQQALTGRPGWGGLGQEPAAARHEQGGRRQEAGVAPEGQGGLRPGQALRGQERSVVPRAAARSAIRVPDGSLGFYRRYTEVFLRRYMQLSFRMGQVPSVLGSCMFRGRVSSRPARTFEDSVLLVLDVEKCMKKLTEEDRAVIARVAMQEYTQEEAAELLGMSHRTLVRRYGEAMDALTRILLDTELMDVESLYPGM